MPDLGNDFSGMTDAITKSTSIGQYTTFSVNEHGCEGASVAYELQRLGLPPEKAIRPLVFNKPFIWTVMNHRNGEVIFNGVVRNPLERSSPMGTN